MTQEPIDPTQLRQWIGRSVTEHDELALFPARGMAALLDQDPDAFQHGSMLPPAWHWLYFKPTTPQSQLGPDGHARRGAFLPPVPLPQRMWAGGSMRFLAPLHIGQTGRRVATIRDVVLKEGRSGPLVFVTVHHSIAGPDGPACDEEQHIVYRNPASPQHAAPSHLPPDRTEWHESFLPTTVALFRFSALTFNGHRIHYDQAWARDREGHPDVLVHAPLTALLLLDAAARHHGPVRPVRFEYRAIAPLFAEQPVTLRGAFPSHDRQPLFASRPDGTDAMTATVDWPPQT